jgi:C1A family cysteine protease
MDPTAVYAILDTFKTTHKAKSIQAEPFTKEDQARLDMLVPNEKLYSNEFSPYLHVQPRASKTRDYKADYSVHKEGVDLRKFATPIKSQDNGKCTAYAGTGAMEATINQFKIIPGLDLSDWDAWDKYGVYSCDSFIRALSQPKNKICDEPNYPQYKSRTAKCEQTKYAVISKYRYLAQATQEIIRSLNENHIVYIGMSTPNDIVRCRPVVNPANGFARGGHAMVILGYLPQTCTTTCPEPILIVRNSWGTGCADKGYHYMPISMFKRTGHNSAYWEIIEVNTNGEVVPPTPPNPDLPTDPNCVKWQRIWWKPWAFKCIEWKK